MSTARRYLNSRREQVTIPGRACKLRTNGQAGPPQCNSRKREQMQ
jgi:hypothetical protein